MLKLIISLFLVSLFYTACNQPVKKSLTSAGYDLANPLIIKMPAVLNEISGIAFNKGMADTIYAEQDEAGKLFYFTLPGVIVKDQKFGRKGDYEDIAICNGTVVMLRSDGVLFSFPLDLHAGEVENNVRETAGLLPGGEYEGLYADDTTGLLYVLCKHCKSSKDADKVAGYVLTLHMGNQISLTGTFDLDITAVAAKMHAKKLAFKPSALAKSARDNQWYIVSSVNKLLVITDDKWIVQQVYPLDPSVFNQPEGIAFDAANNLYISNERGETASATVLKFSPGKK